MSLTKMTITIIKHYLSIVGVVLSHGFGNLPGASKPTVEKNLKHQRFFYAIFFLFSLSTLSLPITRSTESTLPVALYLTFFFFFASYCRLLMIQSSQRGGV